MTVNLIMNTCFSEFKDRYVMSIASRKYREFQEREQLILKTAFNMLHTEGYIGFTIDKLAKKIDYAKGTVYKHFSCKEDILLQIMIDGFSQRGRLIGRAVDLDRTEREIFVAANVGAKLYNTLNPNLNKLYNIARVESIWNKVSEELRKKHSELVKGSYELFDELLQRAVKNGNLELGEHESSDIYFTLISINFGYDSLAGEIDKPSVSGRFSHCPGDASLIKNASRALSLNANTYLDGLGWKPLSTEYDYFALEKEIARTLYSDLTEMHKNGEYFEYVSSNEL